MTVPQSPSHETLTVARHGHAYAQVRISQGEDQLYRVGVDMRYEHGGFSITMADEGFTTQEKARIVGIKAILRQMHKPFPSDPKSVKEQLSSMNRQLREQIQQQSLF